MIPERNISLESGRSRDRAAFKEVVVEDRLEIKEILLKVRPALIPALFIGLICGIAAFLYTRTIEDQYLAVAKYTIKSESLSGGPEVEGALSSFLPFAGSGTNEVDQAEERIMSRDFILSLFDTADFETDPFFAFENRPIGVIGALRNAILGPPPVTPEIRTAYIIDKFRKVVSIGLSQTNIIEVEMRHTDPAAAARIANAIVQTHLDNIEAKRIAADQASIRRIEERLIEAQRRLDEAQEAARIFALENNIGSQEKLAFSSLNMSGFRREIEELDAIIAGIDYLADRRAAGATDTIDVEDFFAEHAKAFGPLQRELGWREEQGRIPLPSESRLASLAQSFLEDRNRLQRRLQVLESEANKEAEMAGRILQLERDIEVRKSIYAVMVKQSETYSLTAHLKNDRGEWIQAASPPLDPYWPSETIRGAVGLVVGMFAVIGIALMRASMSGKIYSTEKLAQTLRSEIIAENVGRLVGYRAQSFTALARRTRKLSDPALIDLIFSLRESNARSVLVLGIPWTAVARNLAVIIGNSLALSGKSVAVLDLSNKTRSKDLLKEHGLAVAEKKSGIIEYFNWVPSTTGDEGERKLDETLAEIEEAFDHTIIVGAPFNISIMQNRLAMRRTRNVVVVAQKGATKEADVENLGKILQPFPNARVQAVLG